MIYRLVRYAPLYLYDGAASRVIETVGLGEIVVVVGAKKLHGALPWRIFMSPHGKIGIAHFDPADCRDMFEEVRDLSIEK